MLYPILMWFGVTQIVGSVILLMLQHKYGNGIEVYYQNVILITAICNVILSGAAFFFYQRDAARRKVGGLVTDSPIDGRFGWLQGLLLLFMGAGMSHVMNMIMNVLRVFIQDTVYQENMELITQGKSIGMLLICMGIIGPIAEELIFRWLIYLRLRDHLRVLASVIISGLIFGVFHGNVFQAIYASILGMLFAWIFEITGNLWSSILLHMGANIWSILLPEIAQKALGTPLAGVVSATILAVIGISAAGVLYFKKKQDPLKKRRI